MFVLQLVFKRHICDVSTMDGDRHTFLSPRYYILPLIGSYTVKISFDRLALLAVLDRNKNVLQTIISVVLATLVALFGYILLTRDYFYDFWVFVICFVIAKCQFSLLKSVQPDSASPIHGHNNTIVFSRAIYFCITAFLIIGLDEATKLDAASIELYGVHIYSQETLIFARDILIGFILAFPIIFVIGLLPQISTFMMHVLEQVLLNTLLPLIFGRGWPKIRGAEKV